MKLKRFVLTFLFVMIVSVIVTSSNVLAAEVFSPKTATFDVTKVLYSDVNDIQKIPEFHFEFEPVSVSQTPNIGGAKDLSQMPIIQSVKTYSSWKTEDSDDRNFHYKLTQKVMASVEFTQMGKYRYKIYEKDESDEHINVKYDENQYEIEFEVFKIDMNGDGVYDALDYNYHIFETVEDASKTELVFVNKEKIESYIVLEKHVTGKKGDTTKLFNFTLNMSKTDRKYPYYIEETADGENYEVLDDSYGTIENGVLEIQLKHNQRVVIRDVFIDTEFNVTEEEVKDYTTKYSFNDKRENKGVATDNITIVEGMNKVVFTNDNSTIDEKIEDIVEEIINTGDIAVYLLVTIFLGSAFGIALVSSRRHKTEQ